MSRDDWVTAFVNELVLRQRPGIGMKFARLVAGTEWLTGHADDPAEAAARWAAQSAGAAPTKKAPSKR